MLLGNIRQRLEKAIYTHNFNDLIVDFQSNCELVLSKIPIKSQDLTLPTFSINHIFNRVKLTFCSATTKTLATNDDFYGNNLYGCRLLKKRIVMR
jgi:hypothetical protein